MQRMLEAMAEGSLDAGDAEAFTKFQRGLPPQPGGSNG